ncbi:ABC transporter permease [Aestuariivirga sp.]|jgi:peptide/nickel transport system permease protein|uniref:ABC transporter permease n=1 Tax=Aestuariivirga sp. TaxID=2650926 RepID=UPI00378532BB
MTGWRATLAAVLWQPSGAAGIAIVALQLLIALAAPLIVPHDPASQDAAAILQPPSLTHLFGTDRLGRDVFSRTLLGGREAMLISTLSTLFAMAWGAVLGIIVALTGGRLDAAVMRVVDAMVAVPWILLVMLFVAALGSSTVALIPLLGFSYGLAVVYLARSAALDFVTRDFVLAAQVRGESRWTIALKEILPNIRDSLAVQAAMQWSWIFLAVSSLSFLGMGVAPPTPDWGQMISDARGIMRSAPWTVIWPMIFLSSLIIGVNLAVDAWAKALGVGRSGRVPHA